MRAAFLLLLVLFSGCSKRHLGLETRYHLLYDLPSVQVGAPDPEQQCPPIGQSLYVHWRLKNLYSLYKNWSIHLYIRFGFCPDESLDIPLQSSKGSYTYSLLGKEYDNKGGIITYRAELIGDGQCLEVVTHPLWCERIVLEACEIESGESFSTK